MNEDGEVVISWLQPEAAVEIMASLTDPDGSSGANLTCNRTQTIADVVDVEEWTVSEVVAEYPLILKRNDDHWGDALRNRKQRRPTYQPGGAALNDDDPLNRIDAGKFLRVTAMLHRKHREAGEEDQDGACRCRPMPVQARGPRRKSERVTLTLTEDKLERSAAGVR